ncbi:MAG: nicotinamide-nucleotide amidohydrolase family protein [Planctomycetes bacterium]|nr:nicotinamide-nucleotide amidohydrolase family protein [Planctomycetota bacterium]
MKKASIVSIGNELLNGQTVNTNTTYLSSELLSNGIPVVSSYTISDDVDAIVRVFNLAVADADIVLVTGGLGPTDDDLTRQAFAGYLGTELQLQAELLDRLENFFKKRNLRMPDKNKIQAYIPAGAKPIENSLGTAPGIMAEVNPVRKLEWGPKGRSFLSNGVKGKLIFALPGVPSEMKRMFAESVLSELQRFTGGQAVVVRKLRCFGAGESTIAEMLGPACRRGRNPLVNCTVESGIITLHIIASSRDKDAAREMAKKEEKTIRNMLGDLVYGAAEQRLADVVGEKLAQQGKTIAVAESCTGGTVARLLTDIPGASKYFTHGWITYSNAAKTGELGVAADLIDKYGAVSEQVAEAMAQGARKKARTDFAIGITGIAGPDGGTEQKPVGLVYISVDSDNGCDTKRCLFSHDRRSIRLRAAQTALNMLRLKLNI